MEVQVERSRLLEPSWLKFERRDFMVQRVMHLVKPTGEVACQVIYPRTRKTTGESYESAIIWYFPRHVVENLPRPVGEEYPEFFFEGTAYRLVRVLPALPTQLEEGRIYRTESGMGGTFRMRYKGLSYGRYLFDNISSGWKGHDCWYTADELLQGKVWDYDDRERL